MFLTLQILPMLFNVSAEERNSNIMTNDFLTGQFSTKETSSNPSESHSLLRLVTSAAIPSSLPSSFSPELVETFVLPTPLAPLSRSTTTSYQPFNHENLTEAYCDAKYNMKNEKVRGNHTYSNLTTFGIVAPTISASISFISSSLIIYMIIFRTPTKLDSIYHRIMFGLSFSDIMSSIAIAFTFLPWPKDVINTEAENAACYLINLPLHGNTASCATQGFFYMFGSITAGYFNMSLCCYYACRIGRMMRDDEIRRSGMELALLLIPLLVGGGIAFSALFLQMLNPSTGSSWCTFSK